MTAHCFYGDSNLIPSNYMLQHGYHLTELLLIGLKMLLYFFHSLELCFIICDVRGYIEEIILKKGEGIFQKGN